MSVCPASFSTGGGVKPRLYRIYIPLKDNDKRRIRPGVIAKIEDKITDHFGGSTAHSGKGCYFSEKSQKIECEPVRFVDSIRIYELSSRPACDQWIDDERFLDRLSEEIGVLFGQEAVAGVAMELDTFYVPGEKRPQAFPELVMADDL